VPARTLERQPNVGSAPWYRTVAPQFYASRERGVSGLAAATRRRSPASEMSDRDAVHSRLSFWSLCVECIDGMRFTHPGECFSVRGQTL